MCSTGDSQESVSNFAIFPAFDEPIICKLPSCMMIVLLDIVCAVSLPIRVVDVKLPVLGKAKVRIPALLTH